MEVAHVTQTNAAAGRVALGEVHTLAKSSARLLSFLLLPALAVLSEEPFLASAPPRLGRAHRVGHALSRVPTGVALGDSRLALAVLRVESLGAVAETSLRGGALGVGHTLSEPRARSLCADRFLAGVTDADKLWPALTSAQHAVTEGVLYAGVR